MDFKLQYGQIVVMTLKVNGIAVEMEKLRFLGPLSNQGDWLHFRNTKTGENHLVKPDQYPVSNFKMGPENACQIIYHD